ncbi:hypothetical protein [Gordonia sp. (in: high G+C Gram-positive bacteria)]|uniref:hypothetical protein n=1 Tax=Gordonia sp. (in: high G+C Gram-positive bacteria) TaxID=84139 RepID=UPI0033429429
MTCDEPSDSAFTVGDVLAPSGITALLDRPVTDVLDDLGLDPTPAPLQVRFPELPGIDLPALPMLPGLDPAALVKPIIDLLGTFGTGRLSGPGNPVESLTSLSGLMDSGAAALLKAISAVDGQWQGTAGTAAIAKASSTAAESGLIAAQGTSMAGDVTVAAGIVGAGMTALQGVVAKTVGLLAATAPTLATPPGQLAALGIAADGLAQGLAIVASTRAQLAAPTAKLAATGKPVPVGKVPTPGGVPSGDALSGLLGKAGPLITAGLSVVGSMLGGTTGAAPTVTAPTGVGPSITGTKATCCSSCTPSTGTPPASPQSTTTPPTTQPGTVKPASLASVPSGSTPSVSVPDQPIRLADCPTTSNASVSVEPAEPQSTVSAVSSTGTGGVPLAPLAAAGTARPVESPTMRAVDTVHTVDAEPHPSTSDADLAALLAQPFGVDVDLRLVAGDTDLAESV